MCGLNAIFAYTAGAPPVDMAELVAVRDSMAVRGPDGAGDWLAADGRVGFGHRRLSIIDLAAAANQPMSLDSGRLVIAYNGEIYNFRELRAELETQGRRFVTHSDTEVLLHLYDRDGAAMVERLRGMFAFALWDTDRQGLLLARDPFGIKPLYYVDNGRTLRVASQVKALLAGNGIAGDPDPAGHAGFFLLGSVPEPHTLYRSIRSLPAGSTLWADRSGVGKPRSYFDVARTLAACEDQDYFGKLRDHLSESVRAHLVADVPVGIFLSAGLDSATIAALAAEAPGAGQLETITLAFDEFAGSPQDEAPLAESVAAALGTRHRTQRITATAFRNERDRLLAAMDQPTVDGVNVYFVAQAAARAGLKVALSGLGGDELFCGYDSFQQIPRLVGALSGVPGIAAGGHLLRVLTVPILGRFASPKTAGIFEFGSTFGGAYLLRRGLFMPWELPTVMDADMARSGLAELDLVGRLEATHRAVSGPRRKVAALELTWYMRHQLLRDADWAGMAHGLEIRTPWVDATLFRALAPVLGTPAGPDKRAMAKTPARMLPRAALGRPKTGFSVPVRDWLLGEDAGQERGLRGWARMAHRACWPN